MEEAGSGTQECRPLPLDTVSRGTAGIETRPHSARLYGREGATEYYNFHSFGQGVPSVGVGFF